MRGLWGGDDYGHDEDWCGCLIWIMSGFFNSLKSLASGAANAAKYPEDEDDDEGG